MSYLVALQSAAFYFMACTPCMNVRHRSKAKARAKREREEKDRIEAENPGVYRHPSPFSASPHWDEEIRMGPSLPKKSDRNQSQSRRRLTVGSSSSGQDGATLVAPSTLSNSNTALEMSTGTTAPVTVTTPAPTLATDGTPSSSTALGPNSSGSQLPRLSSSGAGAADDAVSLSIAGSGSGSGSSWNFKRYQREDEELWGHSSTHYGTDQLARTGHKLMDAIVKAGSSAGRLLDSTLGKEGGKEVTNQERRHFYSPSFRNPPVNDYHPPVVSSRPAHRGGSRWMLQPPPPVKVMEAKVPVSRSISVASTVSSSRLSLAKGIPGGDASLGRLVGERLMDAKLRGDGAVSPSLAPPRPRRATVSSSRSKQSRRSRSPWSGSEESSEEGGMRTPRSRRASQRSRVSQPGPSAPDVESDDDDSDWFGPTPSPASPAAAQTQQQGLGQAHAHHAARRPGLATILSSEASVSSGKDAVPAQSLQSILVAVDPNAASDSKQTAPTSTPGAVTDARGAAADGDETSEDVNSQSVNSSPALSLP